MTLLISRNEIRPDVTEGQQLRVVFHASELIVGMDIVVAKTGYNRNGTIRVSKGFLKRLGDFLIIACDFLLCACDVRITIMSVVISVMQLPLILSNVYLALSPVQMTKSILSFHSLAIQSIE